MFSMLRSTLPVGHQEKVIAANKALYTRKVRDFRYYQSELIMKVEKLRSGIANLKNEIRVCKNELRYIIILEDRSEETTKELEGLRQTLSLNCIAWEAIQINRDTSDILQEAQETAKDNYENTVVLQALFCGRKTKETKANLLEKRHLLIKRKIDRMIENMPPELKQQRRNLMKKIEEVKDKKSSQLKQILFLRSLISQMEQIVNSKKDKAQVLQLERKIRQAEIKNIDRALRRARKSSLASNSEQMCGPALIEKPLWPRTDPTQTQNPKTVQDFRHLLSSAKRPPIIKGPVKPMRMMATPKPKTDKGTDSTISKSLISAKGKPESRDPKTGNKPRAGRWRTFINGILEKRKAITALEKGIEDVNKKIEEANEVLRQLNEKEEEPERVRLKKQFQKLTEELCSIETMIRSAESSKDEESMKLDLMGEEICSALSALSQSEGVITLFDYKRLEEEPKEIKRYATVQALREQYSSGKFFLEKMKVMEAMIRDELKTYEKDLDFKITENMIYGNIPYLVIEKKEKRENLIKESIELGTSKSQWIASYKQAACRITAYQLRSINQNYLNLCISAKVLGIQEEKHYELSAELRAIEKPLLIPDHNPEKAAKLIKKINSKIKIAPEI